MRAPLDPHRHARAKELFARALALPPERRRELLERECGADTALAGEVDELLRHAEALDPTFLDPAAPADLPRLVIPGYRLLQRLGDGGSGDVYRAEQLEPRRHVALKLLRAGAPGSRQAQRFRQEAQLLAQLGHPGIAHVYGSGEVQSDTGPLPWIALEFVEGVHLTDHVRARTLGVRATLALFVALCDAVAHAHTRGIVHLDLKPSNVLVDVQGRVRVLDFGIARSLVDERTTAERTRTGMLLGTLEYMSPEQARGERRTVGASADVYALGVMLFEALTGELPLGLDPAFVFEGVRRLSEDPPLRLRTLRPELPRDLETILITALHKDPRRRYANAGALGADLAALLAERSIDARRPSALDRAAKFVRRHRALSLSAVVVVAALASALFVSRRALAIERDAHVRTSDTLEHIAATVFELAPRLGFGEDQRPGLEVVVDHIAAELAVDPSNDDLRATRARALFELGILALARKDPAACERASDEAARSLADLLARRPHDLEAWSLLSRTYAKLGEARRDLGDEPGKEHWFRRAYQLDLRLVDQNPGNGELLEDLGWSRCRMMEVLRAHGDEAGAQGLAERRLEEAKLLVARDDGNWKYVNNLSHAHAIVAMQRWAEARLDAAAEHVEEAFRLANVLLELEPGRRDFVHWMFAVSRTAMQLYELRFDLDTAQRFAELRFQAALDLCAGEPSRLDHLEDLGGSAHELVRLGSRRGAAAEVVRAHDRYLDAIRRARGAGVSPERCDALFAHAEALDLRIGSESDGDSAEAASRGTARGE